MADQIVVPFHGAGSGVGELTWGQSEVWQSIQRSGVSSTIGGVSTVPPGTTVADVAAVLRFIMSRHQSLRTRLRFDTEDGRPLQEVATCGDAVLEVVDCSSDAAAVADAVSDRYLNADFDYATDWPVRMAAIRCDGVVTHSVAVYLHLAIDGAGLDVLLADLATRDPLTGEAPAPVDAVQPLELARRQRSTSALRQSEASLRHWERVLRAVPPVRFAGPTNRGEPRFRMAGYRSPATLLAVHALAAHHDTDSSPVLLAAFAVALTEVTGMSPAVTLLAVSNRFRPGLAATVGQVAQASPCVVDTAAATFGEVIARARKAALGTYLHAYYDPARRATLTDTVTRDRGVEVDLGCTFNDRRRQAPDPVAPRPTPPALTAAVALGTFRTIPRTDLSRQKLYLGVDDVPGAIDLTMSADTHFVSPGDMERIFRTMESTVVAAATELASSTEVR